MIMRVRCKKHAFALGISSITDIPSRILFKRLLYSLLAIISVRRDCWLQLAKANCRNVVYTWACIYYCITENIDKQRLIRRLEVKLQGGHMGSTISVKCSWIKRTACIIDICLQTWTLRYLLVV